VVWAIDFGKMSFNHAEQFQDTLFIPFSWDWHTDLGKVQAFVTGF